MRILNEFNSSTVTGTGAALSVTMGFKPVCMIVYDETNANVVWLFIQGLADGKALQIKNHDTAQVSLLSTNGFTASSTGMTLGSSISVSSAVLRYIAF